MSRYLNDLEDVEEGQEKWLIALLHDRSKEIGLMLEDLSELHDQVYDVVIHQDRFELLIKEGISQIDEFNQSDHEEVSVAEIVEHPQLDDETRDRIEEARGDAKVRKEEAREHLKTAKELLVLKEEIHKIEDVLQDLGEPRYTSADARDDLLELYDEHGVPITTADYDF